MKRLQLAESLAKLDGIKLNARELIDQWILITYDLPVTKEGNKVRFKFLKKVNRLGGVMQSKSCYLLPWNNEAEVAALDVARFVGSTAYIWTSSLPDAETKEKVTHFYDEQLQIRIDSIKERLSRIEFHRGNEEERIAKMMMRKTVIFFNDLLYAAYSRGSSEIFKQVKELHKQIEEVQQEILV